MKGEGLKSSIIGTTFKSLSVEYKHDIFDENATDVLQHLERLNASERTLLILYAELNSLQKVANIYNCSKVTIFKQIVKIREKLKPLIKNV